MSTGKKQDRKSSGGTLSGMRAGMRRMAGTGSSKRKKQPPSFNEVFGWVLGVALLVAIIYLFMRG